MAGCRQDSTTNRCLRYVGRADILYPTSLRSFVPGPGLMQRSESYLLDQLVGSSG